jgi:hypothetical protein
VSENLIQPMIRDLVFLSPLHPTLGAPERRNLGTDVLAPISFLPRWDDAAQCQAFDLIRGLIEILVPFTWDRSRPPATGEMDSAVLYRGELARRPHYE